jgi:hypothetical protein
MKSNASTLSKGVSPPKSKQIPQIPQPPSAKKSSVPRSDSKNSKSHIQSFDRD